MTQAAATGQAADTPAAEADPTAAAPDTPAPDADPAAAPDGTGEQRPPVRFCPHCGSALDVESFVQEYWTSDARMFHVWCEDCGSVFDLRPTERVTTHEPAH